MVRSPQSNLQIRPLLLYPGNTNVHVTVLSRVVALEMTGSRRTISFGLLQDPVWDHCLTVVLVFFLFLTLNLLLILGYMYVAFFFFFGSRFTSAPPTPPPPPVPETRERH
ncbi:hypothetical protein J6590_009373 [Homalodisca vitripennis]|nr:hypothetical protein J6590_009373 [Homalodisca vitripennis]